MGGIRERMGRSMVLGAALLLAACVPSSTADVASAQAMMDLSDAIASLREESSLLQAEVDSLRALVARQDTLVRRVAAATGVPVTGP